MKKVVTIGGGTGNFVVLSGLRKFPLDITAVATMFDSGGSSGKLRDEFGTWPPGDIRQCLIALSKEGHERILQKLFDYRFKKDSSINGHNFGNLFLLALSDILQNNASAIKKAGEILNIKGRVLPVSLDAATLCAELEDGRIIKGEHNIDIPAHDPALGIRRVFLDPAARVYTEAAEAIHHADIIVFGPGDLYTSIIPNLLVAGMPEALRDTNAKTVYIANLVTKHGETDGFVLSDFAREVLAYAGLEKFDCIIANKKSFTRKMRRRYEAEYKHPVAIDKHAGAYAHQLILEDLCDWDNALRHDSTKLAETIYVF